MAPTKRRSNIYLALTTAFQPEGKRLKTLHSGMDTSFERPGAGVKTTTNYIYNDSRRKRQTRKKPRGILGHRDLYSCAIGHSNTDHSCPWNIDQGYLHKTFLPHPTSPSLMSRTITHTQTGRSSSQPSSKSDLCWKSTSFTASWRPKDSGRFGFNPQRG